MLIILSPLFKDMKKLLDQNSLVNPLKTGEIVEGKMINKGRASVFLDLSPRGTGIIYGKEFYEAKGKLKDLKIGDSIFAKVVDLENEQGYIELSLSKAGRELAWDTLNQQRQKGENILVKIRRVNKGGLMTEVMGIPAFLPVSQLSSENYPKVEDGDSQKILSALQKFIGKELEVKILDLNEREEKLILSEKAKEAEKIQEVLKNYKVGDVVEGIITGVVDFGAFIKFGKENLEGLIHISELDWQLIEDPAKILKIDEKVQVKIIDISNDKVSLSLKALKKDPWLDIEKKYKKGDIMEGTATKFNPFGVFVKISDRIQGLCHISEFGSQKKMEEVIKIGKKYHFQILSIEPAEHRMSLRLAKE